MDRRKFLMRASGALLIASSPVSAAETASGSSPTKEKLPGDDTVFSRQHWQIISAVQAQLLPAEPDSPGASDINALAYLYEVLADPRLDPVDRDFVKEGVLQLEEVARDMQGQGFLTLSSTQRETVLRRLETTSKGEQWIVTLLEYILEALLTDPVYGGNPGGIGWAWLGHHPGFPRPPLHKKYYLL